MNGVLERLSQDFQNNLLNEIKAQLIEEFAERNSDSICEQVVDSLNRLILNKIEVSVKCRN